MAARLRRVPAALIALRIALAPALLACAVTGAIGWWFFAGLTLALLSDILDGALARRIGASTEGLRLWDGWADTLFYLSLSAGLWFHARAAVVQLLWPLSILVVLQVAMHAFAYLKYGRGPSYHGVTAKAWGLGLFLTFVIAFATPQVAGALWIAILLGYINALDEFAMTAILPRWHQDVLTIGSALALRRRDAALEGES